MVTEKTIKKLIQRNDQPKITLTFPTHKIGDERQQNPIRLKNQLAKATEKLRDSGMKNDQIEKLLQPAKSLLEQPLFWASMEKGMIVYLTPDFFEVFKIPFQLRETAYVNDHFLVTPLLPMISTNGTFAILTLSQQKLRLLRCTRTSVVDITPDNIPVAIDEYLEEKPEQHIQLHSGTREGDGAMYFGHGSSEEDRKEITEQYFYDVEKGITDTMKRFNDPLLLAGLKTNISTYKKINDYSRLLQDTITRNPDNDSDEALRDQGWDIIREHFLSGMYKSLDLFKESDSSRVSRDPGEIITSTVMGKSAALFISKDFVRWGKYDEKNHKVFFRSQPENNDVDLMNWVSIKGIETGSNVYVLPKEEMPDQSEIAAIFRF